MAELVARAFSPALAERQSSSHENDIDDGQDYDSDRPTGVVHDTVASESDALNSDGTQTTSNSHGQNNIDDNDFRQGAGAGLMGNLLRIIGLDNGKLGALAMNGLIFIAQIVCNS